MKAEADMAGHAQTISFVDILHEQAAVSAAEPETQRILVLETRPELSRTMTALCKALDIELIPIASRHDLPLNLHRHQPMAVVCVIDPDEQGSITALRSIAAHDQEMPVMIITCDDPVSLGTIDAAERLWGLTGLHCVHQIPSPQDLIGFLFQAGRRRQTGRLLPVS
jgi:hypothetical protein